MEERGEEGERAFQKVAGLKQRRDRASVQITKTDGPGANPASLPGRREGQAMLPYLGGSGWVLAGTA